MSVSSSSMRWLVFIMGFSFMFPMFAYAFTFDIAEPESQLGVISLEALMEAGIDIQNAKTYNITYNSVPVIYDLNSTYEYRVRWLATDTFFFERSNLYIPGFWSYMLTPPDYDVAFYSTANIILNWNEQYNWTWISIRSTPDRTADAEVLFNIPTSSDGTYAYANMTACLAAQVNCSVTVGRGWETDQVSLVGFVNWWWRSLTGLETYGMPTFFVWLMRLINIIGLAVAVIVIRSFLPG